MCNCGSKTLSSNCKSNQYKERRVNSVINKLKTLIVIATDPNDIEEYQLILDTTLNGDSCVTNEDLRLIENYVDNEYNKYSEL